MGKNREICLTRYNTLGVKAGDDREYYEIEVDGNYTCEEFSHEELVMLHELIERAMEEKEWMSGKERRFVMADYLVTYKFIGLTREELDKLVDEIFEEMGIVPLRVEKVEE